MAHIAVRSARLWFLDLKDCLDLWSISFVPRTTRRCVGWVFPGKLYGGGFFYDRLCGGWFLNDKLFDGGFTSHGVGWGLPGQALRGGVLYGRTCGGWFLYDKLYGGGLFFDTLCAAV